MPGYVHGSISSNDRRGSRPEWRTNFANPFDGSVTGKSIETLAKQNVNPIVWSEGRRRGVAIFFSPNAPFQDAIVVERKQAIRGCINGPAGINRNPPDAA